MLHLDNLPYNNYTHSMSTYDPGVEANNNCISLHRNENLFVDPLFLSNLAIQASKEVHFNFYPDSTSYELRKMIGAYHNHPPEEIYIGNGADGVLADLFQLFREQYDEMGLQPCTYQVYPYLCKRYNYTPKNLYETNQLWVIDSPSAITGELYDFSNQSLNPETLIWDNVYSEFVDINQPSPKHANLIKIHSFSKFYALASLRIGYCIANSELILKLLQRKDIFNVNAFAQKMAILALNNQEYFNSLVTKMLDSKARLSKELSQLGFVLSNAKTNFLWITHPKIPMKWLQNELNKDSILVRRFELPLLQNFLRITVPPQHIRDELIKKIKDKINIFSS